MNKFKEVKSGVVAWMANHTVASNLLMLILLIGGFISVKNLKQEVFPEFSLDIINITVPYPGATPTEVEQGIILLIEENVRGLNGVKSVTSTSMESVGTINVEVLLGDDPNLVLADVKNAVDRISNLPKDAETPTVSVVKPQKSVVSLLIAGDEEFSILHDLAEKVRVDLLAIDGISQVDLKGVPALELEVSISQSRLEALGLTIAELSQQIRQASVELGGGSLETNKGKVLVRVADRKVSLQDFEEIRIRSSRGGTEVPLKEIAILKDGYEDSDLSYLFNGDRVIELLVSRVGKETPTGVASLVKNYQEELSAELPSNITIATWNDRSKLLDQRIDLLVRNAKSGLILVIIILALFLQKRLALWVALGIPISFLGAFIIMGWMGLSINMISLFALIITLGMVVDDAIVVAENVFDKMQLGLSPIQAAIQGTQEMVAPVTFSILTTITAFSPLLFVPGVMGKIFVIIPMVVISVLIISLIECYFILPAHLGHKEEESEGETIDGTNYPEGSNKTSLGSKLDDVQEKANAWLNKIITEKYKPLLEIVLHHKHLTMSISTAILILVIATVPAGLVKFSFFPKVEADIVSASIKLPYGSPIETTEKIGKILEEAQLKSAKEFGEEKFLSSYLKIGEGASGRGPGGKGGASGSHLLTMSVELVPSDDRDFGAQQYAAKWKEAFPDLPGIESITIGSSGGPSAGKSVDIQLSHVNTQVLAKASKELQEAFLGFPALKDVENSFSNGKPQLDIKLIDGAKNLGFSASEIGSAVRSSFFGNEVLRQQRGRNEMKVVVRLPEEERSSEMQLKNLLLKSKQGSFIPLSEVSEYSYEEAPTEIKRENGLRVVNVSADLIPGKSTENEMNTTIKEGILKELLQKYPGLSAGTAGVAKSQKESMQSLGPNFLKALLVIFTLLAIPFRSYIQPLIVMSAIPFGIVGAIIGHIVLGYDLTMISFLGIIALSGVVVNDSLVLVDAINKFKKEGYTTYDAVVKAGQRRFRPILLTSLTTFFGLLPMIFETSMQAKFLIPMAISIGFGALFVTAIVLIVVPALFLIVEDLRPLPSKIKYRLFG